MWLSKQQKREERSGGAAGGTVTLTGERVAVELDSERRGLAVYGPGGYRWRPAVGQDVLVIKTADGLCVVGTPSDGGLAEGEVGLAAGGAAVTLKPEGRVLLEGRVEVSGGLFVNGEGLEEMIRRIAGEVAGGQ